jgi:hypothetical protein
MLEGTVESFEHNSQSRQATTRRAPENFMPSFFLKYIEAIGSKNSGREKTPSLIATQMVLSQ